MFNLKNLLLLIVCFALFLKSNSQTGPGGVGDGSANLMLWLRADVGVESSTGVDATNGDNVSSWLDQSGDNNDASSINAPNYQTAQHNGYPAVHFTSGSSEYMNIPDYTNFPSGNEDRTYIFVGEGSSGAGNQNLLYHGSTNATVAGYGRRINITNNNNEISMAINGHRYGSTLTSSTALRVGTIVFPVGSTDSDEFTFYDNGGLTASSGLAGNVQTINTDNEIARIGANRNISRFYDGDMCELIVFDREINDAEFIIIHNYVSAKYGTTLAANDLYTQDDSGNGDFDHHVAGIGRVNGSNSHSDSQGTGIVRINNPSALSNGDYLFWGEDTKDYTFSTNTSTYREHLNSKWRVNKVNDLGTVTVTFDISGIDLSAKQSCQDLEFVVDNNSDFSSPTVYSLTISGSTATATLVSFNDGDYFSLRYLDQIVWDGTSFFNGSGTANAPNNTDNCLKFTVKSGITGSLTSDAYVREVEVESGGTLNVADGILLEVDDQVVIDGVLDLLGESQLIQKHTNTTSNSGSGVLVKRQQGSNSLFNYNYWSAPVNTGGFWQIGYLEDTAGVINFHSNVDANPATSPITLSSRWLYGFNGLIGSYSDWSALTTTSDLSPGIGYTMKGSGTTDPEQEYIFKGTPNDGNYSIAVSAGNEVLIGNPYPSALNADQFISDNASVIEGTLYFWEQGTTNNSHYLNEYIGGYASYNSLMGIAAGATPDASGLTSGTSFTAKGVPTGNIGVAQGFFAPIDNTGSIIFNNQQRIFAKESDVTDAPIFHKNTNKKTAKTNNDLRPKIWFSFTDPSQVISFLGLGYDSDNATTGYDKGYDGKLYKDKDNDMYWMLNDEKLIIQALPNINIEDELPITIKVTDDGLYKFAIDKMENVPEDLNIFLKDNYSNTYYNLKNETTELFLQSNIYEDQYTIVFQENNSLTTDAYQSKNLSVFYDKKTKSLIINNDTILNDIESISIYNSIGQEVLNLESLDTNRINMSKFNSGIYIISANTTTNKNIAKFLKH